MVMEPWKVLSWFNHSSFTYLLLLCCMLFTVVDSGIFILSASNLQLYESRKQSIRHRDDSQSLGLSQISMPCE